MTEEITFSIAAPVFNEIEIVGEFYKRVEHVMDSLGESWELILVDDGSTDGSTEKILELSEADSRVVPVIFARNFGHQIAITALKGKLSLFWMQIFRTLQK
jgi:glycosyltransferase involved in cell wall biosynthesis